jgi:hypothetical protein
VRPVETAPADGRGAVLSCSKEKMIGGDGVEDRRPFVWFHRGSTSVVKDGTRIRRSTEVAPLRFLMKHRLK